MASCLFAAIAMPTAVPRLEHVSPLAFTVHGHSVLSCWACHIEVPPKRRMSCPQLPRFGPIFQTRSGQTVVSTYSGCDLRNVGHEHETYPALELQ